MCAGRLDEASIVYNRLVRKAINDRQRGIAMQNLGSIHAQKGEWEWAAEAYESSRYLFRAAGYARGEVIALNNLGRLAHDQGDLVESEALLKEALAGAREVADAELAALALINLAQVRVARGMLAEAMPMAAEAFGHFSVSENRWRQIECLCVLADISEGEGQVQQVRVHLERARAIAREIGSRVDLEKIEERLEKVNREP
jgi:tetratricopeptide (TPR) repeat protein